MARLVEGWVCATTWVVTGLVLAEAILVWLLVTRPDAPVTTPYDSAVLAEIGLVHVLLGSAAWHRFRLTSALTIIMPGAGAGAHLAASLGWEILAMVLVFWAVSETTSTSPSGRDEPTQAG
ncbi:CopD family protein [Muricoccus nepalensis]|uniref:CopD family protein n=1 Tax=Muricoccus nepalensis TaxID=1854500 RepID=UPI0013875CCA